MLFGVVFVGNYLIIPTKLKKVMNNTVIDAKTYYETTSSQLQKQKETIKKIRFASEIERITHLKEHYLGLLVDSQLADSIWQFELSFPIGTRKRKKKYITNALEYLNLFFHKHKPLFVYYRRGETHLDHEIFDIDNPMLETYAKTITAELFDKYLNNRYEGRKTVPNTSSITLTWTNKQVALVELAAAFHEAKVFNNGEISLSTIINSLAENFNLKLTQDHNRILQDIKNRKKHLIYS
jgi:RteC protein